LDILVSHFESKGWVVSPLSLASEMYVAGVKSASIPGKVSGLFEAHSPEWRIEVENQVRVMLPTTLQEQIASEKIDAEEKEINYGK